jgi:hypothetical protein
MLVECHLGRCGFPQPVRESSRSFRSVRGDRHVAGTFPRTVGKELLMQPDPSSRVGFFTFAATLCLAFMLAAPAGVRAGQLMDTLSPQARRTVDDLVRYAVAYDRCRGDYEMSDAEADAIVARLSEAVQELPQYAKLEPDGRKVLLLNLLFEMQREAATAPAPDCSVARVGGKGV